MPTKPNTFEKVLRILYENSVLNENGCFIWLGATSGSLGYGKIRCDNKQYSIHRLVYEKFICTDIDVIRHQCNTPRCWNPKHLIDGSQQDNINDMVKQERHAIGEKQSGAILTGMLVQFIRQLPVMDTELAKFYGTTKTAIRHARIRRTWKHIQW